MITFEDCMGLCELTEAEVEAIAEHEHIPETAALELGHYLLHAPGGTLRISEMIRDDIGAASTRGDVRHAAKLKMALKYFMLMHPQHEPMPAAA
ncbi:MAG: hypothetical protein SFV19_09085 [Rhodospirillaceae bacterium]|nr:hypothetical protein [Rhodospirillaceae bacterium]